MLARNSDIDKTHTEESDIFKRSISKVCPEGGGRGVLDLGPVLLYHPPPPADPLHALVRDGGGGARLLKARSEVLIFWKQYLKTKNDVAISI